MNLKELRAKLDQYAFGLNIKTKTMHGSEVGDLYNQARMGDPSKWQDIATYCGHDVTITKEVLKRYLKDYEERNPEPSTPQKPFNESEIPFG